MATTVQELLARLPGMPAAPVAIEALWDGDTQGWFVDLCAVVVTAGQHESRVLHRCRRRRATARRRSRGGASPSGRLENGAMTADDMLREASDPTTPVERLRVLYAKATGHHYDAVVRNPSLPLDLLRWELLAGSTMAWFNPATEALLLAEPLPVYEQAARTTLGSYLGLTAAQTNERSLAELIGQAPPWRDGGELLAHRLADLFGLPWTEAI